MTRLIAREMENECITIHSICKIYYEPISNYNTQIDPLLSNIFNYRQMAKQAIEKTTRPSTIYREIL